MSNHSVQALVELVSDALAEFAHSESYIGPDDIEKWLVSQLQLTLMTLCI